MTKYRDSDVTILRIAGENDPGYDPRIPKVFIRDERGERLILRSDLDESMDVSDEQKRAMAEAQGRSTNPIDMEVEERRREARRRGMPPDQTPAPFLRTATGREVPNPDALETDGRAATLEQEKQAAPTIRNTPTGGAIQDRGDPRHGMSAPTAEDQKESSERAIREDAEKAKENEAEQKRQQEQAEKDRQRQQEQQASDADAKEKQRLADEAQRQRDQERPQGQQSPPKPVEEQTPAAPAKNPDPPPGTQEGLGEDQRRNRALQEGNINPA